MGIKDLGSLSVCQFLTDCHVTQNDDILDFIGIVKHSPFHDESRYAYYLFSIRLTFNFIV